MLSSSLSDESNSDESQESPDRDLAPMDCGDTTGPPLPTANEEAAVFRFFCSFLSLFLWRKTFSSSEPRANTSSPTRMTASPDGSTLYLSTKRDRSLAFGGRPRW